MAFKTFQEEFMVSSESRTQIIDVTGKIEDIVKGSKVKEGVCIVFVPHATAAVVLNENESGLVKDIEDYIKKNFPYFFLFAMRTNPFDEKASWIEDHIAAG